MVEDSRKVLDYIKENISRNVMDSKKAEEDSRTKN